MAQGKRIKVILEEDDFPQLIDTIRKTYFFVPASLKTIDDLGSALLQKFNLKGDCPYGLNLLVNGFCLPPSEPISVVRDEDQVR